MNYLPQPLQNLIENLAKFPGIGPKSAARLAFYILNIPLSQAEDLAASILQLKNKISFCNICFNISESEQCNICKNPERQDNQIMVVEDVLDLIAFERIGDYKGKYHILGGVISPINGIGPTELNMDSLINRVKKHVQSKNIELIIATNPNLEGEATAMYIKQELSEANNISITRIARGVPTGADLDYADSGTLSKALSGRVQL